MLKNIWKSTLAWTTSTVLLAGALLIPLPGPGVSAEQPYKIACVGDGLTAGTNLSDADARYPAVLGQLFGSEAVVQNFGVSGRSLLADSANAYTKSQQYADSKAFLPDMVILMLGTQDASASVQKDKIKSGLTALIDDYRALSSKPTVVVATIPAAYSTLHGVAPANVQKIAELQREVAAEAGCPLIDVNALLKDPAQYQDGVYLNADGYATLAAIVKDGIQTIRQPVVQEFSVDGCQADIDNDNGTIQLTLPAGTDLTALQPNVVLPLQGKMSQADLEDLSKPVTFTVTSADGKATKEFAVTASCFDPGNLNNSPINIACVGDSITRGAGTSHDKAYPARLQAKLNAQYGTGKFKVLNAGADGMGVQKTSKFNGGPGTGYYGNCPQYTQSVDFAPDILIFGLGANDSKISSNETNWVNEQTFKKDYQELLDLYLALPKKPIVIIGVSVMAYKDSFGITDAIVSGQVAPIQKQVATAYGLAMVDANTYSKEHFTANDYIDDGVHLSAEGYDKLADLYFAKIREIYDSASDASIHRFAVGDSTGDMESGIIRIAMPVGTDLTSVTPDITIAKGATVTPQGPQDFTQPVTYTVTAPNGDKSSFMVYATLRKPVKVACVGDSITAGGFPQYLSFMLGSNYEVRNFGQNSVTVCKNGKLEKMNGQFGPGAYVDQPIYQQSLNFLPDVVISLLGANDSKQKQPGDSADWVTNWTAENKASFSSDYQALITSYLDLPSKPVYMLGIPYLPPKETRAWAISYDNLKNDIIPMQRALAQKLQLPTVDIGQVMTGDLSLLGGDKLHPSDKGNYVIALEYYKAIMGQDLMQNPTVTSIDIANPPTKRFYKNFEDLDVAGGTISVQLSDGSVIEIPIQPAMADDGILNGDVIRTITITYGGASTTFRVAVMTSAPGDVDDSGAVNVTDARLALQSAVQKVNLSMAAEVVADVNFDGALTTTDARLILQYAVKKINGFSFE